jgi:hypothetical protein
MNATPTIRGRRRGCAICSLAFLVGCLLWPLAGAAIAQPLASWNDGSAKQAIVKFVIDVTTEGAATGVAPSERIAVFDNDGTLWAEQPINFKLAFALDPVKVIAPQMEG